MNLLNLGEILIVVIYLLNSLRTVVVIFKIHRSLYKTIYCFWKIDF
jgi:hypothetical protein